MTDLGCGWGELLFRAVERTPALLGQGVDTNELNLARGRLAAQRRGLGDRVTLSNLDVLRYTGKADRVICIGASHAWGGTDAALRALRRHVEPSGRLLFGDGFWVRNPSQALVEMFGQLHSNAESLTVSAARAGWRPLEVEVADMGEWDEFEKKWTRAFEVFAQQHRDLPLATEVRTFISARRDQYVHGYRGVLGFVYLVLQA